MPLFVAAAMKELTLIRHAKSSWSENALSDHDRPLNPRGERDAPKMGALLAERGFAPAAILSSTALRARTTAEIIARQIGRDPGEIVLVPEIYEASVSQLMTVVRNLDESLPSAVLFGHNPGFEDFANRLLPGSPVAHMPTCAVARLRLKIQFWGEVSESCGELIEFLYPKMLP